MPPWTCPSESIGEWCFAVLASGAQRSGEQQDTTHLETLHSAAFGRRPLRAAHVSQSSSPSWGIGI